MSEALRCELVVDQDEGESSTADGERGLIELEEERECSCKACSNVGCFSFDGMVSRMRISCLRQLGRAFDEAQSRPMLSVSITWGEGVMET